MPDRDYGADGAADRGDAMRVERPVDGPGVELVVSAPVPVVSVTGELHRSQGTVLCGRLVEAVDLHPAGLVIDLAGLAAPLQGTAPEALRPLAGLLKAFAGRPVALCGRPSWLRPPQLPVLRDRAAAEEYVNAAVSPPRVAVPFGRVPEAAAEARQIATEVCERWRLSSALAGSVQLVLTELVNNAVLHAGTGLVLTITLTGEDVVHLAVRDGSTVVPRRQQHVGAPLASGRGFTLIEAFSAEWGVTPLPDGKIIWAEVRPHG